MEAPDLFRMSFITLAQALSITLPVRNQNQGNIAAAQASALAAQRRMAFVTLMIRQKVAGSFTHILCPTCAEHLHGACAVARQNLEVVRKTYELGRVSLLDLIAEQRRYIDIETGYTEALKQTYDAVVEIERTVGTMDH